MLNIELRSRRRSVIVTKLAKGKHFMVIRVAMLCVSIALAGCGSDDGGGGGDEPCDTTEAKEPICASGRADECPCLDGTAGVQVCADDGSKWGKCECAADSQPVVAIVQVKDVCVWQDQEPTVAGICLAGETLWARCALDAGQVATGCIERMFGGEQFFCCRGK